MQNIETISEFQKNAQWAMACTALEFSDDVVQATNHSLIETFKRIETGQTTYDEEEARLLKQWNMLKGQANYG